MLFVVLLLDKAPARRLGHRVAHRVRLAVGVHEDLPVGVARGAAARLDEGARAAQEALFVGVEDRDEGDFGQVEAFPEKIDTDQHVELAAPEVAKNLDAFERVNVAVQIPNANTKLGVVLGQILGHALRQRGHEHALVLGGALPDAREQIVDLTGDGAHGDRRIEQPRRPDDLLDDDAVGLLDLVVGRRRLLS